MVQVWLSKTLVASSVVHSDRSIFLLKNILHFPKASANLISINKFCIDNDCFFQWIGIDFTMKDNQTRTVLLQGPSENGLYLIHLQKPLYKSKSFAALLGVKTTGTVWHMRLGHPSDSILQRLVTTQCLPSVLSAYKSHVCEVCQLVKSKQLPFLASTRIFSFRIGPLWCLDISCSISKWLSFLCYFRRWL